MMRRTLPSFVTAKLDSDDDRDVSEGGRHSKRERKARYVCRTPQLAPISKGKTPKLIDVADVHTRGSGGKRERERENKVSRSR